MLINLRRFLAIICICALTGAFLYVDKTEAQTQAKELKTEADELNRDLNSKKGRVKEIQGMINTYRDRINSQETEQLNLSNQILLLDNRIKEKELRIEEAKVQIEVLTMELQVLNKNIERQEGRMSTQKQLIQDLLRRIRHADDIDVLHVFLSRPSLSAYFDQTEQIKRLDGDLAQAMERVKQEKINLENDKNAREAKRIGLENTRKSLKHEMTNLESERYAKQSLLAQTQNKQEEFRRMLDELRQQNESTVDEIANLEKTLKDKLNAIDEALAKGQTLLLWPVPVRKVTATFHDPTYPFKHLFQHPGIDLWASVGTPIKAAGGGYVAWTKQGKSYGNYMMIIHPGNFATVYAHLSKFQAKAGTYVERGDVIGYTGGMPGQPGAGLSTGPHLHFEVRHDGIPVDPMGFLPEVIELDD
ncbi:MAG: Murein DD-endopeptidase MepM [Parcubacteria group bacterium ADurb.Bin192]|nr:MAG: Murein DD-endopeptidase MepM [Parcubacteria group bacterium ADurb.Bin192]